MIGIGYIDLADPSDRGPEGAGPFRILVRHGIDNLGEMSVDDLAEVLRSIGGVRGLAVDHFPVEIRAAADRVEHESLPPKAFTVVVCTRNRAGLLDGCLAHLRDLDPLPGQILVVDNAPNDTETEQLARRHGVDYVVEPAAGLDRARNRGRRESSGEVVVYVDDDARAGRALVGAYGRVFVDPEIGAASGLVLPFELATPAQIAFERLGGMRKGFERRFFDPRIVGMQSFQLGAGTNMAFRRTVLDAIGGFDPHLDVGTPSRGGGDLDALWRVLDAGFGVEYEPNAVVRHIHRRTLAGLIDQHRDYGTAYRAVLERALQRSPHRAAEVRRELRRWHWHRHVRGPLGALRRRDLLAARLLVAEALGSRVGVASVQVPLLDYAS